MARLAAEYGPQTRRAHAPTTPSKVRIFLTGHAVLPLLRGAGERFWKGRPEGRIIFHVADQITSNWSLMANLYPRTI